MNVCDASLLGDALLVGGETGGTALQRLAATRSWHAPELIGAELTSVARRLVRAGLVEATVAAGALDRFQRMDLTLHPWAPYQARTWQLRDNATPYDAWYLALAERLDVPLVTADAKLADLPGVRCAVEVLIR